MKPPRLVFTSRGLESEVARIGADIVGEIMPFPGSRRSQVAWMVRRLGDRQQKQGPAKDRAAARAAIAYEVEEWLIGIGWLGHGERLEVVAPEKEKVPA